MIFRTITCRYTRVANSGFPHHTIASLRQVGMMGLTPLHMKISYMLTVTSS